MKGTQGSIVKDQGWQTGKEIYLCERATLNVKQLVNKLIKFRSMDKFDEFFKLSLEEEEVYEFEDGIETIDY